MIKIVFGREQTTFKIDAVDGFNGGEYEMEIIRRMSTQHEHLLQDLGSRIKKFTIINIYYYSVDIK